MISPTFPTPNPPIGAGIGGRQPPAAVRGGAASGLGEKKGRRKKGGRAGPVDSALPRHAGWRGKAAAPVHVARQARAHASPRAVPGQGGTPAAPLHVARQRLSAAPRRQGAAKGVTRCK
jgi:hypothetical protein